MNCYNIQYLNSVYINIFKKAYCFVIQSENAIFFPMQSRCNDGQ